MGDNGVTFDFKSLGRQFRIAGDFVAAAPYGSGHINDTFAAVYDQGGTEVRYIHQRVNHHVFPDVPGLMDNISRVTAHLRHQLTAVGADQISRRALTIVPTCDGATYHRDAAGNFWRTYIFIEKAKTYDIIETTRQAYEAAKAFGAFQRDLADLPGARLHEIIPGFHHTRQRFQALQQAIAADSCNRAAHVVDEIAFAEAHEPMVDVLLDLQAAGDLPERTTHNDTKLNNVMIDDATGRGICVIDLDTVMPGLSLYDFGDMVRTAARPTAEDETDLCKVVVRTDMFGALARGYLEAAGEFLVPAEIDHLVFSGQLISLEIGLRFLTDYLEGDRYFKTRRPGHNLDRCRTQFAMVRSIREHEEVLQGYIDRLTKPCGGCGD